ncbi:protein kinase domain-containing protein [Adhaeretor mobilis]|uniref:Serine/threonine-protein kinase PrkC n=1 Tax=Adhaeretor mobilis TaxID=1930276 RepID=A0A517MXK2_9BACT|nr:protein kinase [Adhaeretor mobilis]QDS99614.1 Serine/threonine-protein kinase PrkC [Adhaeretor mobilis]
MSEYRISDTTTESDLDPRLAEALDLYLRELESDGAPPDLDRIITNYSDLDQEIRSYAESLHLLHGLAEDCHQSDKPTSALPVSETKQLGDFQLLKEIGRGAMGVVYEARQLSLDRTVAVKVLPFAAVLDPQQIARFRTEAQAAAQLHHPHIVPVFGVGQERGVHFFAMQFVEGQSLEAAISELRDCSDGRSPGPGRSSNPEGGISDQEFSTQVAITSRLHINSVARLAAEAAKALHHAHENGVVHRDIKPSNLLIDAQGKLWVTDFGLARMQAGVGVTATGDVLGTLRYMSPEQAAGKNALVDARSDVYSLGATLYELLTLQPVHPGDDRQQLLTDIAMRAPTSLRKLNPAIPFDLETVVLKALSKDIASRYSTAGEFADDLQRFLTGKPTQAKRPSLVDRSVKWAVRHRHVATASAVVLAVLAGLSTFSVWRISGEQELTKAALQQSQQSLQSAERHLAQARQVVDRFGGQLAGELAALPGSESIRRKLLIDTLAYYREFLKQAKAGEQISGAVSADVAETAFRAAVIAQQLGDRPQSGQLYEQARKHWLALLEFNPEDVQLLSSLAKCDNNRAELLSHAGELALARKAYEASIARLRQLSEKHSASGEYTVTLAETMSNLGLLEAQASRHEVAESLLMQAIDLLEGHAAEEDSDRSRHDLAIALNNLSYVLRQTEPTGSLQACEWAKVILESLTTNNPHEREYRSDLAQCLSNEAALHSSSGNTSAARDACLAAIKLQRRLIRQAPGMPGYRRNLAVSLNNFAQFAGNAQRDEALQYFEDALEVVSQLAEDYPQEPEFASLQAGILNNQGMQYERLLQWEEASGVYQEAIVVQRKVFETRPTVEARDQLSRHYFNYGRSLRESGDPATAIEVALQRKALWPKHGEHLYQVAIELAQAAELVNVEKVTADVDILKPSAETARLAAIETWQESLAAGYTGSPLGEDALAKRGEATLQALVAQAESKIPPAELLESESP